MCKFDRGKIFQNYLVKRGIYFNLKCVELYKIINCHYSVKKRNFPAAKIICLSKSSGEVKHMLSLSGSSAFRSGVYQACECVKSRERKTERVTRDGMCA